MAITVSRRTEGFQRSNLNRKQTRQAQQQQQQQQQHLPPSPTTTIPPATANLPSTIPSAAAAAATVAVGAVGTARMKRPLDPIENLSDPLKTKRNRIAVEIFARPLGQPLSAPKPILVKRQLPATQPAPVASSRPGRPSPTTTDPLPAVLPTPSAPTVGLPAPVLSTTTAPPPLIATTATTTAGNENVLTSHQEKVVNGTQQDLGQLPPGDADAGSASGPTGRKLRSQEVTRFKSELAAYFPEYDEVIGNDPKEQHLLNVDTPIIILDTEHGSFDGIPVTNSSATTATTSTRSHLIPLGPRPYSSTVRSYGDHLFTNLQNSATVNFDFLRAQHSDHYEDDPLPDSQFEPAHKRATRLEKSIRNTERGRAQHEKDQIIRLLGELQGHDWLRTMGVNGVTESRRKSFEPARDHFVRGCQAILDKFRSWSQEEKRRKLERERALAEESGEDEEGEDSQQERDEDGDEDEEEEDDDITDDRGFRQEVGSINDIDMADVGGERDDDPTSEGELPEYSDVDAAARQLHDEAMQRARYAMSTSPRWARGEPPPTMVDSTPREFTSFFEKRHQRDAALSKGRRRGRTILAWGHPVPEMSEYNFELPDFCLDEDTLRIRERQKRRDRRQRKQ